MHKIDNASANTVKPTRSGVGPKPDAYFDDALKTVVPADWLNAIQEEVSGVVEDAGMALDKADDTQLLVALKKLFYGAASVKHLTIPMTGSGYPMLQTIEVAHGLPSDDIQISLNVRKEGGTVDASQNFVSATSAQGDMVSFGAGPVFVNPPAAGLIKVYMFSNQGPDTQPIIASIECKLRDINP